MKIRKLIICFFVTILVIVCGYIILSSVYKENEPNIENNTDGKDISKEEYVYKDDLLELGYTVDEINVIETKIPNTNVKDYLLTTKYDNLTSFVNSKYFNIEHLERYEEYYKKNSTYTPENVVLYVEMGLDIEFYTNIKTADNYKDITTLVNKYNQLPKDASFDDIVTVVKPYSKNGDRRLRKVAYEPLVKMIEDAKEDGIKLWVVSGFRTWAQQNSLFNNAKKNHGLNYALMYSAKPGHSEHQLGLAVDLNTTDENRHFENTEPYKWLKDNSYKYGFIERYPQGKEFITGYAFEPWHYRYLGVDIATILHDENITYEEYQIIHKDK